MEGRTDLTAVYGPSDTGHGEGLACAGDAQDSIRGVSSEGRKRRRFPGEEAFCKTPLPPDPHPLKLLIYA